MRKADMLQWRGGSQAWALAAAVALLLCHPLAADVPRQPRGWKFDLVHLQTGRVFQGLILRQTPATVRFQCIWQNPGERTKLGPETTFTRYEILRITALDPKERADLAARLEELKPA